KTGREEVRYDHPDVQPVLESTYGIIVYQEQVMRIANVLGGYNLAEADVLRKSMGKKIASLIREELTQFVAKAIALGVEKKTAETLAEQIETFGRYGFNLSHSAAYSIIAYHTAWLKAHYPAEFMAAMLSTVVSNTDDVVKYIAECRELPRYLPKLNEGIQVLPPDVNESGWKFTAVGEAHIRFGLGAIRGVGSSAVNSILSAREADGPFTAMFEFLERVDLRALNKRAVEALITAGALDSFGYRSQLFAGLDTAYSEISARKAEEEAGQASLFGTGDAAIEVRDPGLPNVPGWSEQERLKREKEALGFFISGHPLDRFADVVHAFDSVNTANLKEHLGRPLELACVVTKVQRQISRRDNSEWGKITVEDFHGTASVLAFKDNWQKYKETLQQDAVVLLSGKVSGRERDEEDPPIFLDDALLLEGVPNSGQLALQIEFQVGAELDDDVFARAKEVLVARPGTAPVELRLGTDNGAGSPVFRSRTLKADPTHETIEALQEMFGKARVRLVRVAVVRSGSDPLAY
ncbi:MAG: OB-fold nucleic acid binding domain-containing protein, partial [Gemmatimonadota bacterium]|nr:OB-fold nucleic acid binding domain-containing protein [Gemmatimonadota bacterium]